MFSLDLFIVLFLENLLNKITEDKTIIADKNIKKLVKESASAWMLGIMPTYLIWHWQSTMTNHGFVQPAYFTSKLARYLFMAPRFLELMVRIVFASMILVKDVDPDKKIPVQIGILRTKDSLKMMRNLMIVSMFLGVGSFIVDWGSTSRLAFSPMNRLYF